ncbi:hypothetical protein N7481_002459 [Penicillium waksmanii]|uniref:uncharacterized protein n=1 Tax=Penicillium waksmanii TaxID=69791 RepID=UPI002547D386|nr:uncharacterized protein N7481_002459 [Penicillium waksmanii]KAJ5995482.1 hypothetical protein N7481_002459 [Penicillium waksmanii]
MLLNPDIRPMNRSTLVQPRHLHRHEEYITMSADTSRRRPHPANNTSSLAQGMNNFSPHENPVQRQLNPNTDLWSGNIGLTPTRHLNAYGPEMEMNYYTLGALPVELPSSAHVPNPLQPNGAGSSRSDRCESADIDLRCARKIGNIFPGVGANANNL